MQNEGLGFLFWLFVLIVVNQVITGCFCGYVAEQKNRDYWNWFLLGAMFGPMPIALLALIGLPALTDQQRDEWRSKHRQHSGMKNHVAAKVLGAIEENQKTKEVKQGNQFGGWEKL